MSGRILISGGGGYLGFRTALKYLERTQDTVILTVHARSPEEFETKASSLREALGELAPRVELEPVELSEGEPFRRISPRGIRAMLHGAAIIRFNVEEDLAVRINIQGAEKAMKFASQCAELQSFGLMSSIYASGLQVGAVREARLDGQAGFANHYERSKWASEEMLLSKFPELPWKIFRIATVLADDDSGRVVQQNAVHNTLKLFYYGLISLIPGKPDTPVYLVNGDFVAQAIFDGMNRTVSQKIYHVCHAKDSTPRLGELVDLSYEIFGEDPQFKSRRLLKPLFTDSSSFDALVKGAVAFGGSVLSQAVTSIAPFGVQLFIDKDVCNDELVASMENYRKHDSHEQLARTCQFLAQSKFRKVPFSEIRGA